MNEGYFQIEKEFRFEAAHRLPDHDGKCARLHGHSWVGRLVVRGNRLAWGGPKDGMILDYGDMKRVITPILDHYLDHHYLNETIGVHSPTSEAIARWIFERIKNDLPGLHAVVIEETCTSRCIYSEDPE